MRAFTASWPRCGHLSWMGTVRSFATKPFGPYKRPNSSHKKKKLSEALTTGSKSAKSLSKKQSNEPSNISPDNEKKAVMTFSQPNISPENEKRTIMTYLESNKLKEGMLQFASVKRLMPIETWNAVLSVLTRRPDLIKHIYPQLYYAAWKSKSKKSHKNKPTSNQSVQSTAETQSVVDSQLRPIGKPALTTAAVDRFMNDLASSRLLPNAETFKLLMDSASLSLDFESVLSLHGQMAALGVQPDRSTVHCAMSALTELKQYKSVKEMFQKYFTPNAAQSPLKQQELSARQASESSADQSTHSPSSSDPSDSQSASSSQSTSNSQSETHKSPSDNPALLEPDVFTYHLALTALMTANDAFTVWPLWHQMTTAFSYREIDPSLISTYIHFQGMQARFDAMIHEYKVVVDAGVKPPFVMLSSAIQLLSSSVITNSAQKLVTSYGLSTTIHFIEHSTSKGFSRTLLRSRKRARTLEKFVSDVAMFGYRLTYGLYISTILAFAALGDSHRVIRLYNQLLQNHSNPPLLVRRALIAVHAASGDTKTMEGYYHELCAAGHSKDQLSLQAMIRGYAIGKQESKLRSMISTWREVTGPDAQLSEEVRKSLGRFYAETGDIASIVSTVGDLKSASDKDKLNVIKAACNSTSPDATLALFNLLDQMLQTSRPLHIPGLILNSIFTFLFMQADSSDKPRMFELVKHLTSLDHKISDMLMSQICLCFCIVVSKPETTRALRDYEHEFQSHFWNLKRCGLQPGHLVSAIQRAVALMRDHEYARDRISTDLLYSVWKFTRHAYKHQLQSDHYDAVFQLLEYMRQDHTTAMIDAREADEFSRIIPDGLSPSMYVSEIILTNLLRQLDFTSFLQTYASCYRSMLTLKTTAGKDPHLEFHSRGLSMIRDALVNRKQQDKSPVPTLAFSTCDIIITLLAQDLLKHDTIRLGDVDQIIHIYDTIANLITDNSGMEPVDQSINQSTNQSQSPNQSTNQSQSPNQSTNQSTKQSINQPINQSTNQSVTQSDDVSSVDLAASLIDAAQHGKTYSKPVQMRFISIVRNKGLQSGAKSGIPIDAKSTNRKMRSKIYVKPLNDERKRVLIDHQSALQYFASIIVTIGNTQSKVHLTKAENERLQNAARNAKNIVRTLQSMSK